jgi:hypothetical protein
MGLPNQEFDVFSADPHGGMKKILYMKADKLDIEKLYEIKSDK